MKKEMIVQTDMNLLESGSDQKEQNENLFLKRMPQGIAAAYVRVSTEDQLEFSPDSQIKRIREYAAHHQLDLPEEYIFLDEGISGRYAKKRPKFMRMIGMAKQKPRPFDVILVWKFSRFSRNRQESIFYKSMLRKECGIDVISISEQLSDDPTSILIEALLEAMDEYYSINLAQEVKRGMNEKFSRGGVVSIPPFGYKMGEKCFVPDEKCAPCVKIIYEDFLNGISARNIAVKLNNLGVRTIRGNLFEKRSVEYILSNPVYTGKLRRYIKRGKETREAEDIEKRHDGRREIIVKGEHEAIIDEITYKKVQERLQERKISYQSWTKIKNPKTKYVLRGLIKCSNCGATLTLTDNGRSLQCQRYTKGKCTESHHIRLEKLKKLIYQELYRGINNDLNKEDCKQILNILESTKFDEAEKNKELRFYISEITFDRKSTSVKIVYRSLKKTPG